jgi:hypothetical protein
MSHMFWQNDFGQAAVKLERGTTRHMVRGDPCCLTMVRDNNLDSQAHSSCIVSNIQNPLALTTFIGLGSPATLLQVKGMDTSTVLLLHGRRLLRLPAHSGTC